MFDYVGGRMGNRRDKKDKRDQKIANARTNMKDEVELEQTKAILKSAGALNVDTITIEGSTTGDGETSTNFEYGSATYKEKKWEPKLSFSPAELEAKRRAENRLRRRAGRI